jgi:hypothetical protein
LPEVVQCLDNAARPVLGGTEQLLAAVRFTPVAQLRVCVGHHAAVHACKVVWFIVFDWGGESSAALALSARVQRKQLDALLHELAQFCIRCSQLRTWHSKQLDVVAAVAAHHHAHLWTPRLALHL